MKTYEEGIAQGLWLAALKIEELETKRGRKSRHAAALMRESMTARLRQEVCARWPG